MKLSAAETPLLEKGENRFSSAVVGAAKYIVLCFSAAITALLLLMAIFSQVRMDATEKTYFLSGIPAINLVFLALCALVFGILARFFSKAKPSDAALVILTVVCCALIAAFVLSLNIGPSADQYYVSAYAADLLNGNFEQWQTAGYLDAYPNQNGILLYYALLSLIFGQRNFLAFQLANIPFLVLSAYFTAKTAALIFDSERLGRWCYAALLLFLPMNCYATFIYGTLIGLALSAAGLYLVEGYIRGRRVWRAVLGGFLLALACQLKMNYIILLITAAVLLLCDAIKRRSLVSLLAAAVMAAFCVGLGALVSQIIYQITDIKPGRGSPSLLWVAMGLQDGPCAPGWWNGYNRDIYQAVGGDYQAAALDARQSISASLAAFKADWHYALEFFSKKTASQWNDGTFQGVWINMSRSAMGRQAAWADVFRTNGTPLFNAFCNICDLIKLAVYAGSALALGFGWKKADVNRLVYAIALIGGFLFHLVWEAKGQYAIVYFYLIIPYALWGWQSLGEWLAERAAARRGLRGMSRSGRIAAAVAAALILAAAVSNGRLARDTIKLGGDDESYQEYVQHIN